MVEWQYWSVDNGFELIRASNSGGKKPPRRRVGGATLLWSMKGKSDAEVIPACVKRMSDSAREQVVRYREFVREAGVSAIVVAEPGYCRCCRATRKEESEDFYEVTAARASESGWFLEGRILVAPLNGDKSKIQCTCGEIVNSLVSVIPIQFSIRACPKCGRDGLITAVQKIKRAPKGYVFEATLKCKNCGRRNLLRTLLSKIADVLRLEIGPTGITICRK